MNMESLIEEFTCHLHVRQAFNNGRAAEANLAPMAISKRHFFENPKILPCCRQTACNKCIVKLSRSSPTVSRKPCGSNYAVETCDFNCPFCGNKFKFDLNLTTNETDLEANAAATNDYDRSLIDINHYLVKKLDSSLKNIEGNLQFCLFTFQSG